MEIITGSEIERLELSGHSNSKIVSSHRLQGKGYRESRLGFRIGPTN